MTTRELYHGTTGDKILDILQFRIMKPNLDGKIFFSEHRYDSVLMHGADLKRKVTLAIKVRVQIPSGAKIQRDATPGVVDTIVLNTGAPLPAEVLELYIRRPQASLVEIRLGAVEIQRFLMT